MIRYLKEKLKNWVMKSIYKALDPEEVLHIAEVRQPNGAMVKVIMLGDEKITAGELQALKEEVIYFENTRLKRVFENTVREKSIESAFVKSLTYDDAKTGKLMVLNLDILERIAQTIKDARIS